MKPMPTLDDLLKKAKSKGIFGTKERSVINQNNPEGIKAVVRSSSKWRSRCCRTASCRSSSRK
jgi:fructose-bisphosphate aldolase class 1